MLVQPQAQVGDPVGLEPGALEAERGPCGWTGGGRTGGWPSRTKMASSGAAENVRAEGRRVTKPEGQGEVVTGPGEKRREGERKTRRGERAGRGPEEEGGQP